MTAFIFKVIYGIPLFLTTITAKGAGKLFATGTKFLAELVGILLFKARWWVAAICWTLVLYGLVKLEPTVKEHAPDVVWAFYIRVLIVIMGLLILAYVTKNLRRAFRRARLEVQILNKVGGVRQHVVNVRKNANKGGDDTDKTGFIAKIIQRIRQSSEAKDTVHVFTVEGDFVPGSYEETQAAMQAFEAAQMQASLGEGAFPQKERPSWMKLSKKSARANPTDATGVDPLIRAQELEAEAQALRQSMKREEEN